MVATIRSGRSVGKSISQAVAGVGRRLGECQQRIAELDDSINDLVERRGEALVDLAKQYLPEVSQAAVAGSFREIRKDLLGVLARKQRRERQLKEELRSGFESIERLQQELEHVTQELDEKVAEREELEKVVVERLAHHEEFQQLSRQALSAEQELNRNEARVAEIKEDAAEKLPSFEESRLFRYLHEQGYGTAEYDEKGWTRRLDRWVAKMIDFPRARRSYDFLRVTPELMTQEVTRRREQFNVLMEQVEAIEDQIADDVGLTEVMRQGQRLGSERDQLVADVASEREKTESHQQQLLALEGTQNEFYDQAVARMKEFLASMEESHLEYRSRSTPGRKDDEIVAELSWLNEQLDEIKQKSSTIAAEQRSWEHQAEGLQRVLVHFQRAEYDSGRSMFAANFDIEEQLERYLRGDLSHDDLWSAIRLNQHFAPPWYEETGRDIGDIVDSDFSHVLLRVLAEVAGHAMRNAAYRGMRRRGPIRKVFRKRSGRPRFGNWGFTRGRGF